MKFKKKVVSLVAAAVMLSQLPLQSFAEEKQYVYFSDIVLGNAIRAICDLDGNSKIDTEELKLVTEINLSGKQYLESLKGIERIPNLKRLDVSFTPALKEVDLNSCVSLVDINLSGSGVETLNVGFCPKLQKLDASDTSISTINILSAPELSYLDIGGTNINSSIDVSFARQLAIAKDTYAPVDGEGTVSYGSADSVFLRINKGVEVLGITGYPAGSKVIDSGNFPSELFREYVEENFDLNHDFILVPDEINAVTEIDINLTDFSFGWVKYYDIKGVDIFTNLENLYCNYHGLTELDLSKNTKLKRLSISGNDIEEIIIDISTLEWLEVNDTTTKSLIIQNCPNLKEIELTENWELNDFAIINCPAVEKLTFGYNYLESLDVSAFDNLKELYVNASDVSSLDLKNNINLQKLEIYRCPITEVDLSSNKNLISLSIEETELSKIDLSENKELVDVDIYDLNISAIDVSMLTKLDKFSCGKCQVSEVDLSKNENLTYLSLFCTAITELDISHNTKLTYLDLAGTMLDEVDITNCKTLIECYKNPDEILPFGGEYVEWDAIMYSIGDNNLDVEKTTKVVFTEDSTNPNEPVNPEEPVNPDVTPVPESPVNPEEPSDKDQPTNPDVTTIPETPTTTPVEEVNPEQPVNPGETTEPGITTAPEVIPTPEAPEEPTKDVGDFIKRLYEVALERSPEEEGFDYWVNQLKIGEACGAQIGYGILFSPEYINRQTTNEQFITDLYSIEFGREPDTAGFNYWLDILNETQDREHVYAGFANSTEFNNLCNDYGVVAGFYVEGEYLGRQGQINAFVARLYKCCLNRLPDQEGMAMWVSKLVNHEISGTEIATSFVYSQEFINQDLSIEEYVATLYRVFFGREADTEGYKYWVSVLTERGDKDLVFRSFAGSVEFVMLCGLYEVIV